MSSRVRDVVGHARQPFQRVHGLEVAAQAGIHLRPVQHGLLAVEVDELFQRERIPDDVTRHVLDGPFVLDRDRLTDMCREARMAPGVRGRVPSVGRTPGPDLRRGRPSLFLLRGTHEAARNVHPTRERCPLPGRDGRGHRGPAPLPEPRRPYWKSRILRRQILGDEDSTDSVIPGADGGA